jgi:hypothetical protein
MAAATSMRLVLSVPLGWKILGPCETCEAAAGEPCTRVYSKTKTGPKRGKTSFVLREPHPSRSLDIIAPLVMQLLTGVTANCTAEEIEAVFRGNAVDWRPDMTLPEDAYAAK